MYIYQQDTFCKFIRYKFAKSTLLIYIVFVLLFNTMHIYNYTIIFQTFILCIDTHCFEITRFGTNQTCQEHAHTTNIVQI